MQVNVVIGTFLPFHLGHVDLIDFANTFDPEVPLHVIVSTRKREPIQGYARYNAVQETFASNKMIVVHHHDDENAPQNPTSNDDPTFWAYWYNLIHGKINSDRKHALPENTVGTVFASEKYGKKLAAIFGANFVPFDVDRVGIDMSGTKMRANLTNPAYWSYMPRSMRSKLVTPVVVIGTESIGKTTISKALAETNQWVFAPEWARGYLETVGSELSFSKMNTIYKGQHALENMVRKNADSPVIVHDTDLIATYAYHHIAGILPMSQEFTKLMTISPANWNRYKFGELYLLLSDELHFTPDPLRYGGDKRESQNDYWEKLLLHFGVKYVKIPLGTIEETELRCRDAINAHLDEKFKSLKEFVRE